MAKSPCMEIFKDNFDAKNHLNLQKQGTHCPNSLIQFSRAR